MNIFNKLKNIFTVLKEAGKIKEYEKISSLTEQNARLKKTLQQLEEKNSNLSKKLDKKRKLEYKNNAYWDGYDGPFCSRCFDELGKTIHMHPLKHSNNYFECPKCETKVNTTGKPDRSYGLGCNKKPNYG